MANLAEFINPNQLNILRLNEKGEEGEFFTNMLTALDETISIMAATGQTDTTNENKDNGYGLGDDAEIILHYFNGSQDWWITEKDMVATDPQYQAFGIADIGFGLSGLGYISIQELIEHNVELDLYWNVITVKELRDSKK